MRHLRRLLVAGAATDPVWIDNDYAFVCLAKSFTPDAFPAAIHPIYPDLGRIKRHRNVPPIAGLVLLHLAKLQADDKARIIFDVFQDILYSTVQINWNTCGKFKKTQFFRYSTLLA